MHASANHVANYCNFTNKTQGFRANHVANHCNFTNKTQGYRANHVVKIIVTLFFKNTGLCSRSSYAVVSYSPIL